MGTAMDRAKALEAEAKAIRRAEKKFWQDVDDRREEVMEHLDVGHISEDVSDTRLKELADAYDTTQDLLIEYIKNPSVSKHFRQWLRQIQAGRTPEGKEG